MRAEPLHIRFEELYQHAGWVRSLARCLVADSGVAEDLVVYALEGVLRVDGAPAFDWTARLVDVQSRLISEDDPGETTDAEGRFRLARTAPGRCHLLLSAEGGLGLLAEVDAPAGEQALVRLP